MFYWRVDFETNWEIHFVNKNLLTLKLKIQIYELKLANFLNCCYKIHHF